jgi:hypothetical protein
MEMTAIDQRKSKRFDMRLPLQLIRHGSQTIDSTGETMNVSSGGILFKSAVELEVGAPIEYVITLEPGENGDLPVRIHCVGKVVRRHRTPGEAFELPGKGVAIAATLERYEFVRFK